MSLKEDKKHFYLNVVYLDLCISSYNKHFVNDLCIIYAS